MKKLPAAVVLVATVATMAGTAGSASASGPGRGATYVALGDSYAAGEGLGEYEPLTDVPPVGTKNRNPAKNTCHRSLSDAYGSIEQTSRIVLPEVPKADRAFWACAGAWASDMTQYVGGWDINVERYQAEQPAQTDTVRDRNVLLGEGTDWISISAGGNDVNFGGLGKACAVIQVKNEKPTPVVPGVKKGDCDAAIKAAVSLLPDLEVTLESLYSKILNNAPRGVLAVAGYPRIFPEDYANARTVDGGAKLCVTNEYGGKSRLGVLVPDAKRLDGEVIVGLNNAAKAAIESLVRKPEYSGRIAFADSYENADIVPFPCDGRSAPLTVNGVMISQKRNGTDPYGFLSTATFHPTKAGQEVIGRAVQDVFEKSKLRYLGGQVTARGTVGQVFSATASFEGGVPPFRASVLGYDPAPRDEAPNWLATEIRGQQLEIRGTPDLAGSSTFNVYVRDAHDTEVRITFHVSISGTSTGDVSLNFEDGFVSAWSENLRFSSSAQVLAWCNSMCPIWHDSRYAAFGFFDSPGYLDGYASPPIAVNVRNIEFLFYGNAGRHHITWFDASSFGDPSAIPMGEVWADIPPFTPGNTPTPVTISIPEASGVRLGDDGAASTNSVGIDNLSFSR